MNWLEANNQHLTTVWLIWLACVVAVGIFKLWFNGAITTIRLREGGGGPKQLMRDRENMRKVAGAAIFVLTIIASLVSCIIML